ncbi:oligopeptide transport system permease protein [Thermoactinomyces sp. DSM 45891]|uniref:ABC transporter permease n=1 Tax=Thermoactinomyces sp. DSM 45891 TaxID=1761907 RepID=UPI000917BD03|nr:ABC transporter permease [Thermoactinomyces sp. DSM 45891]SFX21061.1 oligopeptide transport system permease protein [Thermoactinomyces sp. DSM 45891]
MARYILKRFSLMIVTLFIIITATFFLIHSLPGSPLQNAEKLTPELQAQILAQYGLDQPIHIQYFKYLGGLVQGDLGTSIANGQSVTGLLMNGFSASVFIGAQGLILGIVIGLILGVLAALKRNTWIDSFATGTSIIGVSVPSFVLAATLSYFIGVELGWLPANLWGTYEHTILPSIALSFPVVAQISRYVRTEMVEVLEQDYMRTAKAKGISRLAITVKHALRNALIPAVTVMGPLAAGIITGSLVVESIFAVPGMGKIFVDSITSKDYTMVMGSTIFYSVLIISALFIVDLLYGIIDPRIRISGAKE